MSHTFPLCFFQGRCTFTGKRKRMNIREILTVLESWFPPEIQESWDNSGLQLGDPGTDLNGIMICLDISAEVLSEAVEQGCNLVISHHPIFFKGIKQITPFQPSYPLITFALQNKLCLYAMHTNLDNHAEGLNRYLGEIIGLTGMEVLRPTGSLKKLVTFCPTDHLERVRDSLFQAGAGKIGQYDSCSYTLKGFGTFRASQQANPYVGKRGALHTEEEYRLEVIYPVHLESGILKALKQNHPYEEVAYDCYPLSNTNPLVGSGLIGTLSSKLPEKDFLEMIKGRLSLMCLRHTRLAGRVITRVAICTGSGAFLVKDARAGGADAFLTGDIKYHDFQEADQRLLLADIGHFESECLVKEMLVNRLKEKFPNFAVLISKREVNPVCYF